MGSRYNAAHVSEADVKEAWANYSKYSYYYKDEITKAETQLKEVSASAKAQLAAKGIFEGDSKYQQEMDRITNIARADIASLQSGLQSLESGGIYKLLTEAPITKYSAGNYQAYLRGRENVQKAAQHQLSGIAGAESYQVGGRGSEETYYRVPKGALTDFTPTSGGVFANLVEARASRYSLAMEEWAADGAPRTTSISSADYNRLLAEAQGYAASAEQYYQSSMSMPDYYTSVWGAYDPHFDKRKDQEKAASEAARGKAGARAYNIQTQPKGQPGGGKPGNVFMQTPQEVAQEEAPQDEQRKAWWM